MGRATETVTGKVYVRLRFWVWRSWISEWVICHHISLTLFLISKRSSVVDFHIVRRSLRDEITFKISKTWCRYKAVLLIWACVWKLKIFSIFKNSIENIDLSLFKKLQVRKDYPFLFVVPIKVYQQSWVFWPFFRPLEGNIWIHSSLWLDFHTKNKKEKYCSFCFAEFSFDAVDLFSNFDNLLSCFFNFNAKVVWAGGTLIIPWLVLKKLILRMNELII